MQGTRRVMMGAAMVMLVGGCRTATRVVEEPRVDLEMPEGGNRGFLVGTPPAAGGRKTTRQMVETEIEVPPIVKTAPPSLPAPRQAGEPGAPAAEPPGETSDESSKGTSAYAK